MRQSRESLQNPRLPNLRYNFFALSGFNIM